MREVCIPHHLAHENSKGEARGRIRHKNNNNKSIKKPGRKERGQEGENLKQGLTNDRKLTIEVLEERDSPFYRLD